MGIYTFEAVKQDLLPIKASAETIFTSQIKRLEDETSYLHHSRTPGRDLITSIKDFWTSAQEGFVMTQKMGNLRRLNINPSLMIDATKNVSFEDIDDVLLDLGLAKLKSNPHAMPRMSTYGVAVITLAELSTQGLTTLASLDLPFDQTQSVPEARDYPYNWSRSLSPENIWQSIWDLKKWSQLGLMKPDRLTRTEAERVVASSQFFGWANHRLGQILPQAA